MSPSAARYEDKVCPVCDARYSSEYEYCPLDGARLVDRDADDPFVGRIVADRYRILQPLGQGGMAKLYVAEHIHIHKRVAIKLLKSSLIGNPVMIARFRREALLVSMISHPNVVAVDDFGSLEDGTPFMSMELLSGEPLDALIQRDGRLEEADAVGIVIQAARGLAAAHERGIIHRDVKPQNIFLVQGGDEPLVKILDLGIAKFCCHVEDNQLTQDGLLVGSPSYMSPEQARGDELTPSTDLYSLGVVLFELMTGERPFSASSYAGILTKQIHERPPRIRSKWPELEVSAGLEGIILTCMAKEPEARFADMDALADALVHHRSLLEKAHPPATSPPPRGEVTRDLRPPSRLHRKDFETVVTSVIKGRSFVGKGDEGLEIAPGVVTTALREGVLLERNTYLRMFEGNEAHVNILVDPGPPRDLEVVVAMVEARIGSLEALDLIFLNHHDPDVASNAAVIQQLSGGAIVVCSDDTWRLAQFYGLEQDRFKAVERLGSGRVTLVTGHELVFVPTPYCHFRGAVMLYDPTSGVLFSGDLFGGFSQSKGMMATRADIRGIETFHQLYMPSRDALEFALGQIDALEPAPRIIAPQHGGVITGALLGEIEAALGSLTVGLESYLSSRATHHYLRAINDLLDLGREACGTECVETIVAPFVGDPSSPNAITMEEGVVVDFNVNPRRVVDELVVTLRSKLEGDEGRQLERRATAILSTWNVELPELLVRQKADIDALFTPGGLAR